MLSAERFYRKLIRIKDLPPFSVICPKTKEYAIKYNANQYCVSYRFNDGSRIRIFPDGDKNSDLFLSWGDSDFMYGICGLSYGPSFHSKIFH